MAKAEEQYQKQCLARISHTLAGAGSVLAAPQGPMGAFRALPIQPVSAAALKTPLVPWGTTMPFAIIPQGYEKCGLEQAICPTCQKALLDRIGCGRFSDGVFCSLACHGEWHSASLIRRHEIRMQGISRGE
jgi:hypothetical protein